MLVLKFNLNRSGKPLIRLLVLVLVIKFCGNNFEFVLKLLAQSNRLYLAETKSLLDIALF